MTRLPLEYITLSTPWERQLFMVLIADLVSVLVHVVSVKFVQSNS